jgi:hypothetical protein
MLSDQEKIEIIEDARDDSRRQNFRSTKGSGDTILFDDYLVFLDSMQRIFSPFIISRHKTITRFNRL